MAHQQQQQAHQQQQGQVQDFATSLATLATTLERSVNLHISTTEENRQLVESLRRAGNGHKRQLRPLPEHYLYSAKQDESFVDHIEKLKALKSMQELTENEFIRCIKGSLKGQALRVATAVNEEEFLDKLHGDRHYIEKLEKLFISSQQDRAYRLDFANVALERQLWNSMRNYSTSQRQQR